MVDTYRAYLIDPSQRISQPPVIIDADNDEQAIAAAERLINGRDIELWHGARFVRGFQKKK